MFEFAFSVDKKIVAQNDAFENLVEFDENSYYLPFVKVLDEVCNIFIITIEDNSTKDSKVINSEAIQKGKYIFSDIVQILFLLSSREDEKIKISLLALNENKQELSEIKKIILVKDQNSKQLKFVYICANKKQYSENIEIEYLNFKTELYLITIYETDKNQKK